MRSKPLAGGALAAIVLLLILSAASMRAPAPQSAAFTRGNSSLEIASGAPAAIGNPVEGMELTFIEPVAPSLSVPVAEMVPADTSTLELDRELNPRQNQSSFLQGNVTLPEGGPDPLAERGVSGPAAAQNGAVNIEGISYADGNPFFPPDPTGDVGPGHYFQTVNTSFQIFDKNGAELTGVIENNQIWAGSGGRCATQNDGDPIVLYDPLADRWLFTQFVASSPFALCAAVSVTNDPLGSYYRYEFPFSQLPDYPKYGVWPDAYYVGTNENNYKAHALNRAAMLAGTPAGIITFAGQTNLMLPADLDGATPPPAGTPGLFYTFKDDTYHGGGGDRLELFAFDPDFATPANSTFTQIGNLPVASFTYTVCGFFNLECIPMPGTSQTVDAISEWPMARFVYRNMGSYQTLLGNFTVDVGGDRAGIRWFELRKPGAAWAVHQQGTYSPGSTHRWIGSMAMDKKGNIGLGYSVSSTSVYPSLGYTTRLASDPLGTLRSESILYAGTASQTQAVPRWGDYSGLSIDPADDCTFWYTNMYYASGVSTWKTRIATFTIPGCTSVAGGIKTYLPLVKDDAPIAPPTPTATPTQPAPSDPIDNGTFEAGPAGWQQSSSGGFEVIVNRNSNEPVLPTHSGDWLAWLGGAFNETSIVQQTATVPASAPYLSYWRYLASQETECTWDVASVRVNGTVVQEFGLCGPNNTGAYVRSSVNLSAYAGQTVTIAFRIDTDEALNSNFFLDDVAFATSAAGEGERVPFPDAGWQR